MRDMLADGGPSRRRAPDCYMKCGPGKRPLYAAFDFETDGLGGKIVACSYQMEGELEPTYFCKGDILQKMFFVMCENWQYVWYAHNAQYEWRYFIERLEQRKNDLEIFPRTDSDIFMLVMRLPEYDEGETKAKLVMRDSFAVFPQSLRKFTENFSPDLPKGEIDFETTCFDPKNPDHIAYSKRDSEALLNNLIRFDALLFEHFDIHLRLTAAGTAMAGWLRTLDKDERYYNSKADEDFIRAGYYGGLVFLTDTNPHENATTYDIRSSYPSQMLNRDMPLGNPCRATKISRKDLGIYRVTVRAPRDLIVPILPVRDHKGIMWPAGTFETTATGNELIFAAARGYEVLKVHEGLIWHRRCRPFTKFIKLCVYLRETFVGTALELVAKQMQNSVYGRLAAKLVRRVFYSQINEDDCEGFEPWGAFFVRDEKSDDIKRLPQWAVFITANARLHLLGAVYHAGPANCLYGDTDSLTLKAGHSLPTGPNYGDWQLDKSWESFRASGAKVYAGYGIDKKTGERVLKGAAKGIPRKEWERRKEPGDSTVLEAVFRGENKIVDYVSLEKFAMALKSGYIGTHNATRSLSNLSNSRSWVLLENGKVRPRAFGEKLQSPVDRRERDRLPDIKEG